VNTDFDMTLGAIAAMVLDYAAVAVIIGLLVLDRWLGIRRGITLDTMLVLIAALGTLAWFAGTRLRHRLAADAARADIGRLGRTDDGGLERSSQH
jgi:hypothetical protein